MMLLVRVLGSIAAVALLGACQKALSDAKMRPLPTLVGTEWGPMENDYDQFVAFKSGGEVSGNTGCNNFFGSFEQNGRVVTFGPLASTKKACPGPRMDAERAWLDLMSKVRAADATRMELRLFGENGEELAVLKRRDWD